MPTCEIKKENQTIEGTSTRTRRDVAYSEDIPSSFIITEKWPECIEIFQHAIGKVHLVIQIVSELYIIDINITIVSVC